MQEPNDLHLVLDLNLRGEEFGDRHQDHDEKLPLETNKVDTALQIREGDHVLNPDSFIVFNTFPLFQLIHLAATLEKHTASKMPSTAFDKKAHSGHEELKNLGGEHQV